jgi:hypothetical protein
MATHEQKDLVFEVPDGWEDRTIVAYSAPGNADETNPPNVVVTREKLPPGGSLRRYVNRQLGILARRLDDFELQEQRELNLGGLPAYEIVFQWAGENGVIHQRLAMVERAGTVLHFTLSVAQAEAEAHQAAFDTILSTVRFSRDGAPSEGERTNGTGDAEPAIPPSHPSQPSTPQAQPGMEGLVAAIPPPAPLSAAPPTSPKPIFLALGKATPASAYQLSAPQPSPDEQLLPLAPRLVPAQAPPLPPPEPPPLVKPPTAAEEAVAEDMRRLGRW